MRQLLYLLIFTSIACSSPKRTIVKNSMIGDGKTDNTLALKRLISNATDNVLIPNGNYVFYIRDNTKIEFEGLSSFTIEGSENTLFTFLNYVKNPRISAETIRFKDCNNLVIKNIEFKGCTEKGAPNQNRTKGPVFEKVQKIHIDHCSFSSFNKHNLSIIRGDKDNSNRSHNAEMNIVKYIKKLEELSSTNVLVSNCIFDDIQKGKGGAGVAIFGGININIKNNTFLNDSGYAIIVDDASQKTPLSSYAINNKITISKNIATKANVSFSGVASGLIENNEFKSITTRSYDFEQQKLNFGDQMEEPFMWQNNMHREIRVQNNKLNGLKIQSGGYVVVESNIFKSISNGQTIIFAGGNGIKWKKGHFFDSKTKKEKNANRNIIRNNTIYIAHKDVEVANLYYKKSFNIGDTYIKNKHIILEGGSVAKHVYVPTKKMKPDFEIIKN